MSPREPPHTSTWPEANFVDSRPRRGMPSSTARVIRPIAGCTGAPRGMPMSITRTSPARPLPGAIHRPGLAAWNVAVTSAWTAAPCAAPVEASTPLGTSAATTGASRSLIASIAERAGSRGSPSNPVPRMASITTAAPSSAAGAEGLGRRARQALEVGSRVALKVGGVGEQEDADLAARVAQQPRGDQAVAAVVALAAHDDVGPLGASGRGGGVGEPAARALHELERRDALLLDRPAVGLAHLGRGRAAGPARAEASRGHHGDGAGGAAGVGQRDRDRPASGQHAAEDDLRRTTA